MPVLTAATLVAGVAAATSPLQAMALCLAAFAFWLLLVRPMAFVSLCTVVICTNAADIGSDRWGLPPIAALLVPALGAILVLRALTGHMGLSGTLRVLVSLAVYLLGRALSLLFVMDRAATQAELVSLGKNLLIVLVFVGFLTTMRRVRTVVASAGLSIAGIAALADFQYLTGAFQSDFLGFSNAVLRQISVGASDSWRLTGPLPDANFYGQLLVLGLPLVAYFAVAPGRTWLRVLAAAGALAILLAIVFTYSRGALVGLLLVAFFAAFALRRWPQILALGAGVLMVGLVFTPSHYLDRLAPIWQAATELLTGGQWIMDPALAERLSVIGVALDMSAAHPWFGVGAGQFPVQYGYYALLSGFDLGAPAEAHNFYLETLAEGGLVGLALLAGLLGGALYLARRARLSLVRRGEMTDGLLVRAITLSTLGYLATSIFLHGAYQRFLWLDVALLLSVCSTAQFRPLSGNLTNRFWSLSMTSDRELVGQAFRLMWRWAWLILLFGFVGQFLGIAQADRRPREYAAEQTLLYRFGREYFPVTPGEQRREWGENVLISLDNALFTEMRLMTGQDLFAKTIATEWPQGGPDVPTPEQLAHKFSVTRVQGAALVTVSAVDTDPARADRLVADQIDAYIQARAALFDESTVGFYDTQIRTTLDELAVLTEKRAAIMAKFDFVEGDDPQVEMTVALQPIEAGMTAASDNLAFLSKERAAAQVSDAWRKDVAPVAEVVDGKAAADHPVGLSRAAYAILGCLSGVVSAAMIVFLAAVIFGPQVGRFRLGRRRRAGNATD